MAALTRFVVAALSAGAIAVVGCANGVVSTTGGGDQDASTSGNDAGKRDTGVTPPTGDGGCGNTQTDPKNCGSCGNVCPSGASCSAGKCACTTGSLCNGKCIDTQTDAQNCGACGSPCTGGPPNSTWSCVAGKCTLGCGGNQTACNNVCVDTMTDNSNCGSCGTVCSGGKTCMSSVCSACDGPNTGSCGHNACKTGGALQSGCDGNTQCVSLICILDPFCCTISWDSSCVSEVSDFCGYSCLGC